MKAALCFCLIAVFTATTFVEAKSMSYKKTIDVEKNTVYITDELMEIDEPTFKGKLLN
jgi:hypothetical protein